MLLADGSFDSIHFGIEVTPELHTISSMPDSIWQWVIKSKLLEKKEYIYSDVGYYILKKIAEKITNQSIETTLGNDFYLPLGLSTLGFNPLKRFSLSQIAPTENDTLFRKWLIHGWVHDPGAAMMGGIAAHERGVVAA